MISVRKRFYLFTRIFLSMILDFRKESIFIKKKGYQYAQDKMLKKHERRARQLYHMAIELQGALIKLCQLLSTRVDVLPEPYIRILKPLQDDVPPVKFEKISEVVRSEYKDFDQIFHEIDENPVASASLAQVHKAVLLNSETVVMKILKPGIEDIIDTDFAIIHFVFKILSHLKFFREQFQLKTIFEDFVLITGDELNFEREAYIASHFYSHFKKFPGIKIPNIYHEYTTRRIIVMGFLQGDKISNKNEWLKRKNNPTAVIRKLIEFYVEQIFYTDFIHFDPHPGNLLVADNNEIAVVDFGMSGITTESMRIGLWEALDSLLKKDAKGLIKALDSLGFFRKDFNKYLLLPVFEHLFEDIHKLFDNTKLDRESIQMSIRKIDFKPVLDDLIKVMHTNSLVLPTNWVYIGKTLGSLFGVISSLDPGFKIFSELKPHVKNFIKKNYSYLFKKYTNTLSSNLNALITLPAKIDEFTNKIESGKIIIKVDYSEIHNKIDTFKGFMIRITGFLVFLVSGIFSYLAYKFNYSDICILLSLISLLALSITIFFRNRSKEEELKNRIEKLI